MDKHKLMLRIQAAGFALTEANLYLDSHPACREGLAYYREHKAKYDELVKEYQERFGPLTACASEGTKKWEWVTEPFPWELSANEGGED